MSLFTARAVSTDLRKLGTSQKAKASAWFFKTGKGQYGYGDLFYGVTVPEQRAIARRYGMLPLEQVSLLLKSSVHECRLTGLFILVAQYKKASPTTRRDIVRIYLKHRKWINNWDLVDSIRSLHFGQLFTG